MVSLDTETLNRLFPFYLIVQQADGLRVAETGTSLRALLGDTLVDREVSEVLRFERPRLAAPTASELSRYSEKPFLLKLKRSGVSLRGQFVALDSSRALFLGSVSIDSADCLTRAGISLSAFSPMDPTPSIVVLQRVRELQVEQLSRQFADLKKAIEQRDEFDQFANIDPLTQALNRRGLLSRAKDALAESEPESRWGMMIFDIDNFKEINDWHGHSAGDTVLQAVASRLSAEFEEPDLVSRWGGDEFVVLTRDPPIETEAAHYAERIARVAQPVVHEQKSIALGISAGIATSDTTREVELMIHHADLAMYQGRRKHAGTLSVFDRRLEQDLERCSTVSRLLEPAIAAGEFVPHFQPIVDLCDGRLVGLEVLARWHREDIGHVTPLEFIEIAESRNLMVSFDLMMVERVAVHLARWRQFHPELTAHVNLSAQSFKPGIAREIMQRLDTFSLPPDCLVIELTETSLLVDTSSTQRVAGELIDHGFAIELDDFGTGYSSLTHLKDIPVTGVKVDISFVRDALPDRRTHRLLAGIMHITDSLSLHTVAEGVETEEQRAMLQALGCQYAQGYLFSKPLSPDRCQAMLDDLAGGQELALAA